MAWPQNHGRPWPATNSLHTSVGPTPIRRFVRPVTSQDAPQHVCPANCAMTSKTSRDGSTASCCSPSTKSPSSASSLSRSFPAHAIIGVGTVRTAGQIAAAAEAGAVFAVSRIFMPELVAAAREQQTPYVPGTLIPTEVVIAWNWGCLRLRSHRSARSVVSPT